MVPARVDLAQSPQSSRSYFCPNFHTKLVHVGAPLEAAGLEIKKDGYVSEGRPGGQLGHKTLTSVCVHILSHGTTMASAS